MIRKLARDILIIFFAFSVILMTLNRASIVIMPIMPMESSSGKATIIPFQLMSGNRHRIVRYRAVEADRVVITISVRMVGNILSTDLLVDSGTQQTFAIEGVFDGSDYSEIADPDARSRTFFAALALDLAAITDATYITADITGVTVTETQLGILTAAVV